MQLLKLLLKKEDHHHSSPLAVVDVEPAKAEAGAARAGAARADAKPKPRPRLLGRMISLYKKLYTEYSSKYGEKTCILLMVGKFYELYDFVDSNGNTTTSICSAVERMNIALSEEPNKGPRGETLLKAGIPEQTLHKFAQVLTQDGWTIVVVDQVKENDQVVDRIPTRILSPGTHVETATRQRMSVAALYIESSSTYGMSVMDIPTREVFSLVTQSASEILHMLQVYSVREVLVKSTLDEATIRSMFSIQCTLHLSKTPVDRAYSSELFREEFFHSSVQPTLLPICQVLSLPFPRNAVLEKALCILIQFIKDHFPQQSVPILRHNMHSSSLRVNNNLLEQINYITYKEGQTSILNILEKSRTAIGSRALRERMLTPISCEQELERRWGHVEWATRLLTDPNESTKKMNIERNLKGIYDLPRLHAKLSGGSPTSLDILHLFQSYAHIECLLTDLEDSPLACPDAASIRGFRVSFERYFDEAKATRRENGEFVGFLSAEAEQTAACEKQIQDLLTTWDTVWSKFCRKNGISRCGSWVKGDVQFECPRSIAKSFLQAPKEFDHELKKSGPLVIRSPLATSISSQVQDLCKTLDTALAKELRAICDILWNDLDDKWIEWIGYLDCTITLAAVAIENVWVRPSLSDHLSIQGMRHPLIERKQTRLAYVKHDITLDDKRGWLIYGVNASGKSSLMKAVGISVLLAQAGSFVPADSMCLRPYHSIFSRIWSHDNVWAGLSSFAVEVTELRDILEGANDRSLVLGDELCSGTESVSATALVASTLEHLEEKKAHFLFATHLHDLLKVGCLGSGIAVFHLRVIRTLEGKLIYDRTLQPGSGSSMYGLEVAKAMGLPFSFMERAYSIRKQIGGEESLQSAWNSEIFRERCELCGNSISSQLEVHHIQHREHGGSNQARNLIVLCEACHKAYHAGELEIPPLQQTSEGHERVSLSSKGSVKGSERSQDELETITSTLRKYKGRPPERISAALQEEGISMKTAELKRFIRKG